jgi:putative hemolysin
VERLPSGGFDVPGSFPIHDLEDVGLDLPAGDYTTVAGLVLDQLGRIPETAGDSVVVGGWKLTVLEIEDRAIRRVRITPVD